MARPVKFKVQHFIDIATSTESMQVINFSVGGKALMERCGHLIAAYRYFKLGGIKIKLVPASSLPMDPLGLSYDDDDPQTVDPRDQLSPGLVRITNGEDIFTDISKIPAGNQEAYYNAMMLDPRWFKFGLQSGFSRSAKPIYYQIGQYYQDVYPGAITNLFRGPNADPPTPSGTAAEFAYVPGNAGSGPASTHYVQRDVSETDPHGFFQTGQKGRFGWLRTDAYQTVGTGSGIMDVPMLTPFPEVRVITAVLPKMRKTIYYYRCYVTETVYFSGVRHYAPAIGGVGVNDQVYGSFDDFVNPIFPTPSAPPNNFVQIATLTPMNTGGINDE